MTNWNFIGSWKLLNISSLLLLRGTSRPSARQQIQRNHTKDWVMVHAPPGYSKQDVIIDNSLTISNTKNLPSS
jgi:hypothetical protein